MKGLFKKDIISSKSQFFALLILTILSVILIFLLKQTGAIISTVLMMTTLGMQATDTLSIDQKNHGLLYLMTLPITRKQYVLEKYLILLFDIFVGVVLMTLVSTISLNILNVGLEAKQIFAFSYIIGLLIILLFGMLLKYQFKNGPEKSQMFLSVMGALVAVILGAGFFIVEKTTWGARLWTNVIQFFNDYGYFVVLALITIIFIVVLWIIIQVTKQMFEKLEL